MRSAIQKKYAADEAQQHSRVKPRFQLHNFLVTTKFNLRLLLDDCRRPTACAVCLLMPIQTGHFFYSLTLKNH